MNTTVPIQSNMTVQDLIDILQMVPDKNATVNGKHTAGDRFSYGDHYRLELTWNKVVER